MISLGRLPKSLAAIGATVVAEFDGWLLIRIALGTDSDIPLFVCFLYRIYWLDRVENLVISISHRF